MVRFLLLRFMLHDSLYSLEIKSLLLDVALLLEKVADGTVIQPSSENEEKNRILSDIRSITTADLSAFYSSISSVCALPHIPFFIS